MGDQVEPLLPQPEEEPALGQDAGEGGGGVEDGAAGHGGEGRSRGRGVSYLVLEGRFGCGVWGVGSTGRCQEEGRTGPLRGETPRGTRL